MTINKEFNEQVKQAAAADAKVGLLSTVDSDGYPHITLITTLTVSGIKQLSWGQFSRGISKENIKTNSKTGFLVLTTDKKWCSGITDYSQTQTHGELYEFFNNKPMFRYNSYFGLGAIHIHNLVGVTDMSKLSIPKILIGQLKSKCMKHAIKKTNKSIQIVPPYGHTLAKKLTSMKFLSFIDKRGYPQIIPVFQGALVKNNYFAVANNMNGDIISIIPNGAKIGIYIANFDLVSLLFQGTWIKNKKGGIVKIEKVYNSMLPVPKYIYPQQPLPRVYDEKSVVDSKTN